MKKNLVFLTALRSKDKFFTGRHDDYSWMDYSIKTWEYWCKQNDVDFYIFDKPIESDLVKHRPNWQRWFKMLEFIDKYDQILSVDASIMVRWDAPNFFDISEHKFCALKSRENMKWTWESANGYKPMFNNFDFDVKKYFNSGFVIFNKKHKKLLENFKDFYYKNYDEIVKYQTEIVKRGTEQPVLNYFIQMNNIDLNLLSIKYGVSHMFRWQVLGANWQLKEDPTPFFIKYFYVWIFSGFSDRGLTRKKLMSETWNMVQHHYHARDRFDDILDEVKHKETAKYTVSRKFKRDILETFMTDEYKDKTVLELGTSQGQTTRVLSYIFKKVISIEIDDWNIEQAHITCQGRDNVEIRKFDLYQNKWEFPNDVVVVFIDANHTYEGVMSDVVNSINHFNDPILILDDYGLPSGGVKQAVDQLVLEGKLKIIKQIGEKPQDLKHPSGTVNVDIEGVICKGV